MTSNRKAAPPRDAAAAAWRRRCNWCPRARPRSRRRVPPRGRRSAAPGAVLDLSTSPPGCVPRVRGAPEGGAHDERRFVADGAPRKPSLGTVPRPGSSRSGAARPSPAGDLRAADGAVRRTSPHRPKKAFRGREAPDRTEREPGDETIARTGDRPPDGSGRPPEEAEEVDEAADRRSLVDLGNDAIGKSERRRARRPPATSRRVGAIRGGEDDGPRPAAGRHEERAAGPGDPDLESSTRPHEHPRRALGPPAADDARVWASAPRSPAQASRSRVRTRMEGAPSQGSPGTPEVRVRAPDEPLTTAAGTCRGASRRHTVPAAPQAARTGSRSPPDWRAQSRA